MTTDADVTAGTSFSNRYSGAASDGGSGSSGYLPKAVTINKRDPKYVSSYNPFYMNGPSFDPWNIAESNRKRVLALADEYSQPFKQEAINKYANYLQKYGDKQSPGFLWSMSQAGLDPNNPEVGKAMGVDAKAYAEDYQQAAPAATANVEDGGLLDNLWPDQFWAPAQFVARNAFSALSMPMEAIQGAVRQAGGALSNEDLSWGERVGQAAASVASLAPPVAAIVDGGLIADDKFQNPWEQTDFGQTLLNAAGSGGWDAFTKNQAGVDYAKTLDYMANSDDPEIRAKLNLLGTGQEKQVYALADQIAAQQGFYSNPGWFIDETSQIGEAQRQSTFDAWSIPGQKGNMTAWTAGRGIASVAGGPDSVTYGVVSGLIDGILSIVGDPTIVGSKFGAASKSLRGLGRVMDIASEAKTGVSTTGRFERALLTGKELAKERAALTVTNVNSQALWKQYQAASKVDEKLPVITESEWNLMELGERGNAVRVAKEAMAVDAELNSVMPAIDTIQGYATSIRRNNAYAARGESVALTALDDPEALSRGVELYRDFIANTRLSKMRNGEVYSESKYVAWWKNLSEEDRLIWNEVDGYVDKQMASGKLGGVKSGTEFFSNIEDNVIPWLEKRVSSVGEKAPKSKYANQADRAAAELVLNNKSADAAEQLAAIDTAGATVLDNFEPGVWQRGIVDNEDSLIVWTGKAAPVVANADEIVSPDLGKKILSTFQQVMKQPGNDLRKARIPKADKNSLAAQVAQKIAGIENPIPALKTLLDRPETTFNEVFDFLVKQGLDGYFDDFLRNNGIDGISGVNRTNRNGVWYGDHPSLESYRWPSNADANATMVGGSLDKEAAFAAIPNTAVRTGLRAMTPNGVANWVNDARNTAGKTLNDRNKRIESAIVNSRAAQLRIDNKVKTIADEFSDDSIALRTILSHDAGLMTDSSKGLSVSPEGMRTFLFGSGPTAWMRAKTFGYLTSFVSDGDLAKFKNLKVGSEAWEKTYKELEPKYLGRLSQITTNKWDPDTYKAILRNAVVSADNPAKVDNLIAILSPRFGLDVVPGTMQAGVKVAEKDGARMIRSWRTTDSDTKRYLNRLASERPAQRIVQIDDSDEVVDALVKYGTYGKIDPQEIQMATGRVLQADGTAALTTIAVDELKNMFTKIGSKLVDNLNTLDNVSVAGQKVFFRGAKGQAWKAELKSAAESSTRIFYAGVTGQSREQLRDLRSSLDWILVGDGKSIPMPGIQLESELMTGFVSLPSVDEWGQTINRVAAAIHSKKWVGNVYEGAKRIFDGFFRTGLLVFRGAYILRNAAEMQVRLFLNGHQSVFTDPVSMVGMSIGNALDARRSANYLAKREKFVKDFFVKKGVEPQPQDIIDEIGDAPIESTFSRMYSPYSNTVLNTKWEVGTNEKLAFANHVEDYFTRTRLAHALGDPRVYQSPGVKKFTMITSDAPEFASGWANELITLHRSGTARALLGNVPSSYLDGKIFATNLDAAAAWIRSSDTAAVETREALIGYNKGYEEIFRSEALTKDYLFENQNSVLSRVQDFTMDDPALIEFIKTGVYRDQGQVIDIAKIPDLRERISTLRGALNNKFFTDADMAKTTRTHFSSRGVVVPWVNEGQKLKQGIGFFDAFFSVANKFERIGTLGPEYRMAYWDKIAELTPALRKADIGRATKGAKSTLSTLNRMLDDGKEVNIGKTHPAWAALNKAKEGEGGFLTLDDLHEMAADFAGKHVQGLFYDAAKRNDFWSAMRLVWPFGQSWGNTMVEWTRLANKNPIQVYKAQKAFNAMNEEGSSAIYDFGNNWMFGDYKEGQAPWDKDPNGGFFYSNEYGDTSFMLPFFGRAAAVPINALASMSGYGANVGAVDASSSTNSLNLALGQESPLPGVSAFVGWGLNFLPDSDIVDALKTAANPFGEQDLQSAGIPSWAITTAAGLSSLPFGIGNVFDKVLSPFTEASKNKYARDAGAILYSTGNYNLKDPMSVSKWQNDTRHLASSLLLINGIGKNVSVVSPKLELGIELGNDEMQGEKDQLTGTLSSIGFFGHMSDLYKAENGGDSAAANEQMLRDFGLPAIFALTGNRQGFTQIPSSAARNWARSNMDTAEAYPDYFPLFFVKGDSTDVTARMWMENITKKSTRYKTVEELTNENVTWAMRVQYQRIDGMYQNNVIDSGERKEMRADVADAYAQTDAGMTFNSLDATRRMDQVVMFFNKTPSIQNTQAGIAFKKAIDLRSEALGEARRRSGDSSTTLSGKKQTGIKTMYQQDIQGLINQYPDFKVLGTDLLEEWD